MINYEPLMKLAYTLALQSSDPSTQNSALLVNQHGMYRSWDINRFPDRVSVSAARWERPTKYAYVEHAERNAIYQAVRASEPTEGMTMVSPWAACTDCARAIIQAGIVRLVTHRHGPSSPSWRESTVIADGMLEEAGVDLIVLDSVGPYSSIRRDGKVWNACS